MVHHLALIGGLIAGAVTTFFIVPWLIPKLLEKGIAGVDRNKPTKPKIAEMGGIAAVIGFFAGVSTVMIIDEVHTPDSSRFWLAVSYEERVARVEEPENFDKEFLRLWYAGHGYRGDGEPPEPTDDLIAQVSERYIALYEMLTGQTFEPGAYPANARIASALQEFL